MPKTYFRSSHGATNRNFTKEALIKSVTSATGMGVEVSACHVLVMAVDGQLALARRSGSPGIDLAK